MAPQNPDSLYKDIERRHRKFAPLMIPRKLEENLPFESKEKFRSQSKKDIIRKREDKLPIKSLMTDKDKQVYSMIQRLNTLKREKVSKIHIKFYRKKRRPSK